MQEPLRTITSFCELLRDECQGKLTSHADEYLRFLTDAARRMTALIKALLDHSRIGTAGKAETVSLATVISAVIADLAASISESGARIDVEDLPSLQGSESDFRLLFQNLISNAIKFRIKGKTPRVTLSAQQENGGWIFSVQDNGIGIEEPNNKRIFDIFQRGRSQTEYEGTGIGLAHCRKIVELYGGRIWVESIPDYGSTFYFSIPS